MAFNGEEGALIPLEEAAELTANYREQNPDKAIGFFIGKDILLDLLAQEDCQGIRTYMGCEENGDIKLVMVGADSNEDDILANGLVADKLFACPPYCSRTNALNS